MLPEPLDCPPGILRGHVKKGIPRASASVWVAGRTAVHEAAVALDQNFLPRDGEVEGVVTVGIFQRRHTVLTGPELALHTKRPKYLCHDSLDAGALNLGIDPTAIPRIALLPHPPVGTGYRLMPAQNRVPFSACWSALLRCLSSFV